MKTLLRHTRTGLYFEGAEKWTTDLSRAFDFHFTDRAVRFVEAWDLCEVELAFAFEEPDSLTTASWEATGLRIGS